MRYLILILIISFLIKVVFFALGDWGYGFDEIIVSDIASQHFPLFINTILTEPHPPLFYFLLKIIPGDPFNNPLITKTIASVFNLGLWMITIAYLEKKGFLRVKTIFWGMAILLSSYLVVSSGSILKQDLITLPIFILYLFSSFYILLYSNDKNKELAFNIICFITMMFSGYLYLVVSLPFFIAVWLKYRRVFIVNLLYSIALLSSFVLYISITSKQIAYNSSRFVWLELARNSPFGSITNYLVGVQELTEFNFVVVFIFMLFIVFGLGFLFLRKRAVLFGLTFLLVFLVLMFLKFNLFVRDRYSIFFHLLLTFLAGYSLGKFDIETSLKKLLVICVFMLPSISLFMLYVSSFEIYSSSLKNVAGETPTVLITQKPIEAFIYKRAYLDDYDNIIPASPEVGSTVWNGHITLDILSKEGQFRKMSEEQKSMWLESLKVSTFIYIGVGKNYITYYDSENTTGSVLDQKCSYKEVSFDSPQVYIIKYSDCFTLEEH